MSYYSSAIDYKLTTSRSIQAPHLWGEERRIRSTAIWRSPLPYLPLDFTFLHFALLADAPKVAAALMKNGADISQEMEDYPDLMPLYLTLPRSLSTSPKDLDLALRIACSYALPRTAGFLLTRGANANTTNKYGIAAIHTAVMQRRPWRQFSNVNLLLSRQYGRDISRWDSMLLQTVSTLLDFGADIDLRTRTSRAHECDPKCWRSIDCDQQGQTAVHLASATGVIGLVSRFLDAGADPSLPDGQGNTALYAALVQGHKDIAYRILDVCDDSINPIVNINERTTALHIACRFSFQELVHNLLSRGAYVNVIDSHGRTPLHDVLAWARLDREEEVMLTLGHLANFGADPDTTANRQTPRQLAETHASVGVKDMFLTRKRAQVWRTRRNISYRNLNLPKDAPIDVLNSTLGECGCDPYRMATHTADRDYAKVVGHEQFPKLIAKANLNPTHTVDLVASIWSEPKTSQLIKGLEAHAPLPNLATKLQQQLAEAFPALGEPGGFNGRSPVPGMFNAEAVQFWGGSAERIGSTVEVTAVDSCKNKEELKPGIVGTKTGHGQNSRRWTPLRF